MRVTRSRAPQGTRGDDGVIGFREDSLLRHDLVGLAF